MLWYKFYFNIVKLTKKYQEKKWKTCKQQLQIILLAFLKSYNILFYGI